MGSRVTVEAVAKQPNTVTNEELKELVVELLELFNEIREQQVEIIEKLNDMNLSGDGFRTFNVDEN